MKNIYLQLVNRQHPLTKNNEAQHLVLAPFCEKDIYLQPEVAKQLQRLLTDCQLTEEILILDGYRTEQTQRKLWDFSLAEHGPKYTADFVAYPGCSEHQTGLAVDLGLKGSCHDLIAPTFEKGPVVTKFLAEMANYGFVLRYPPNKQEITGIAYEPWHFRYVGLPHSKIMTTQNWVLEEYLQFLKEASRSIA